VRGEAAGPQAHPQIRGAREPDQQLQQAHPSARQVPAPVYYALGGRSNPDCGAMASRLGEIFADYELDTFAERHHFAPSPSASPPGCSNSGSGLPTATPEGQR
jgi:hypothetical protein